MTLIECFTDSHIDNIVTCLGLRPDRVVFLGDGDRMEAPVRRYQRLLRSRNIPTRVDTRDTRDMDLPQLCQSILELVRGGDDWVIDLTGGEADVVMAVGAAYARLPEEARRQVRIGKYDHSAGTLRNCLRSDAVFPIGEVTLTAQELIGLHGGGFRSETHHIPHTAAPRRIEKLWQQSCADPKLWNDDMKLLGQLESRSVSKTEVFLPLSYLRSSISGFESREEDFRAVLQMLRVLGVIREEKRSGAWSYTYLDPLLRYCTQKAGNILEVKTLLEGRAATENGSPYFQDCQMSVTIDWDGEPRKPYDPDTRNEVDVVLMRGTTPLFISCKNGNVDENELYKLNTVARWFGGPNAKKMLIAANLDPRTQAGLIQRAWDMDIYPVTDPETLSDADWAETFRNAMG